MRSASCDGTSLVHLWIRYATGGGAKRRLSTPEELKKKENRPFVGGGAKRWQFLHAFVACSPALLSVCRSYRAEQQKRRQRRVVFDGRSPCLGRIGHVAGGGRRTRGDATSGRADRRTDGRKAGDQQTDERGSIAFAWHAASASSHGRRGAIGERQRTHHGVRDVLWVLRRTWDQMPGQQTLRKTRNQRFELFT